jgi:LmbE family N-acetylglucosaminyl deacetylase
MNESLSLMCVLAHPDDETLGLGGILAKYAAQDIATYLVTATRGERGWPSDADDYPGPETLGQIRETELRAAAKVLGLRQLSFLNYRDGELDQADAMEAIKKIVGHLRRVRPQVVLTFDPYGVYGHPDHIAISQFTTGAVAAAADPGFAADQEADPHRVSKLYYIAETEAAIATYQNAFGDLSMSIDNEVRHPVGWPSWAITARIDTSSYRDQVWQAIRCHRSQMPSETYASLSEELRRTLWATKTCYRVFSLVNGGREVEEDLFVGLRTK